MGVSQDQPACAGMTLLQDGELNGAVAATNAAAEVMGSPINSLAWIANHLGARGLALRAGDASNILLFGLAVAVTAVLIVMERAALWLLGRLAADPASPIAQDPPPR